MAQASPLSARPPGPGLLPAVRLEVRTPGGTAVYDVGETGFLLGSVPGCDLRLPGAGLPPVLALVARQPGGASVRKLAPIASLLLNGQPLADSPLHDGDCLSLGPVEIVVSVSGGEPPLLRIRLAGSPVSGENAPGSPAPEELLAQRERRLIEQTEELETDRAIWYRRRQEMEDEERRHDEEFRAREERLSTALAELAHQQESLREERAELAVQRHEIVERSARLEQKQQEQDRVGREMSEIRQQLYERYRHRRDRLAGLQQAVRRAARRVQERKQQLDAELEQAAALRTAEGRNELAEKGRLLQEQERQLTERERDLQVESARRVEDFAARERKLEGEREALRKSQAQHQTDLLRLDRLAATLEQRQKQMQKHALEVDRRFEALQRGTREMEEQAGQLDQWHTRLKEGEEETTRQRRDLETGRAELAQRTAALEGQQAMLATLRTRLERLREEHRRQEQALVEQREQQDTAEAEIRSRLAEARRTSEEMRGGKELHGRQQQEFAERRATLEAAVAQLRQAQDRLSAEADHLRQREADLNSAAADQQEQAALLQARTLEVDEQRQRLEADCKALAERASALLRAEQVMTALQEQLRRRSEELAARQKSLEEQAQQGEAARAEAESLRAEVERWRQQGEQDLTAVRANLESQQAELERAKADLADREQGLRGEVDELREVRKKLEAERLVLVSDRQRLEAEQQQAAVAIEAARAEGAALRQALPELEEKAQAALERLARAREQLREHLAEIHGYVRQGRDDLEAARGGLREEQERLRQQEQAVRQRHDEHRLAVAAFRQELSEWQTQLGELKMTLALDEDRLGRRQAAVEQQAQEVASTSQRLAEQAEQLEQEQRAVLQRRQEVDRHLADMREWYRKKLRELARGGEDIEPPTSEGDTTTLAAARPDILAMNAEVEPGDRQLGDLLRSLELVDADTLTALLAEARRQRRTLRQLLLAGNYLTLFQMALIEAGNLDGLVLGPVRVIDRLRSAAHEAVYRVFDPRGNREALLRHLAEAEMQDAVRPDEFRQRFAAAVGLRHPHIAATYEVVEIAGRPAVLQEWLAGLPSNDWPVLAAVPGVWFRLLSQAALGLQTAHQAGLVHGNLHSGQVVFTSEGGVKLCGFGEPAWLAVPPPPQADPDHAGDLLALGRCATAWATPPADGKKGLKPKPLPDSLQRVLRRLCGEDEPYDDVAALLEDLDAAGQAVPANAAAWERFVRQVREQSSDAPLRRSA